MINILTDDGRINDEGGKFAGMMRYDARRAVLKELEDMKLYRGKAANEMVLGTCQRSGDLVEPLLKPQWWVNCDGMAARAVAAVRQNELTILPDSHVKVWYQWLENIQQWCVSRQLWWGHRIPAYRVVVNGIHCEDDADMKYWVVCRSLDEGYSIARDRFPGCEIALQQDEDVLDTWFSSGLFPFSVMKWPNDSEDLRRFYPNTLLETGFDIIFFWVARMVMMGLELTDKLPFKSVFLHPMVRDKYGRKMSKSLGNVVDPLDVITGISLQGLQDKLLNGNLPQHEVEKAMKGQEKDYPKGIGECGADALRFALLDYLAQDRNINLDVDRIFGYRLFCNKIWNAVRLGLTILPESFKANDLVTLQDSNMFVCRWILSRLARTISDCVDGFSSFKFSKTTTAIFDFWMKQFCPVFLEFAKTLNLADNSSALSVIYVCFDQALKLLHPIMPFVTEELYQRISQHCMGKQESFKSIMIAKYPVEHPEWIDEKVEESMALVLDALHAVNSSRDSLDIVKSVRPTVFFRGSQSVLKHLNHGCDIICSIGRLQNISLIELDQPIPQGCVSAVVNADLVLFIAVDGAINVGKQIQKLQKRMQKLQQWISNKEKTMALPSYTQKTPPAVQAAHQEEFRSKQDEFTKLNEAIAQLQSI